MTDRRDVGPIGTLVVFLLFFVSACRVGEDNHFANPEAETFPGISVNGKKAYPNSWTVMLYVNGDNKNFHLAIEDIRQVETSNAGSFPLTLIVLIDGPNEGVPFRDTRIFKYEFNREPSSERLYPEELGFSKMEEIEMNMGAASTLYDFVEFCQSSFPADHYMLHIWQRSEQQEIVCSASPIDSQSLLENTVRELTASLPDIDDSFLIRNALSFDETSKDPLTSADVRTALEGKYLDVISLGKGFSATLENAYELKDTADILVAPAGPSSIFRTEYGKWLMELSCSDLTVQNLLKLFLKSSQTAESDLCSLPFGIYELTRVDDLYDAFENFVLQMMKALQHSRKILSNLGSILRVPSEVSHLEPLYIDLFRLSEILDYHGKKELDLALERTVTLSGKLIANDAWRSAKLKPSLLIYCYTLSESYPNSQKFHLRTSLDYLNGPSSGSGFTSSSYWPQLLYNLLVNLE